MKINRYLPVIVWALLIFLGSSTAGRSVSDSSVIDFLAHKIIHFGEYFIFYLLLYRASGRKFWLSILILTFYALSDEFHQMFVSQRSPSVRDVIIDVASGLSAAFCIWKLLPILPPKLKNSLTSLLKT